jgi:hypothetical protein
MLTAICPVPNGDHAGLNAVQDSTSRVGLLRPTPRLSDEGKGSLFSRSAKCRCWPFSTYRQVAGLVAIGGIAAAQARGCEVAIDLSVIFAAALQTVVFG